MLLYLHNRECASVWESEICTCFFRRANYVCGPITGNSDIYCPIEVGPIHINPIWSGLAIKLTNIQYTQICIKLKYFIVLQPFISLIILVVYWFTSKQFQIDGRTNPNNHIIIWCGCLLQYNTIYFGLDDGVTDQQTKPPEAEMVMASKLGSKLAKVMTNIAQTYSLTGWQWLCLVRNKA